MNQIRIFIGLFIIAMGLGFLFDLPVLRILFPALIIFLGVKILMGWGKPTILKSGIKENKFSRVLVFTGIDSKVTSNDFRGAEVVAVFGGGDIDFSEVKTKATKLKLTFVTVFGGLKIKVPATWNVLTEGVGIMGAFDNKSKTSAKTKIDAHIEGVAIFGGVEIVS